MTGEITLSGLVLPVGGIREKALAARRHGIKTIILPAMNEPDLGELPDGCAEGDDVLPVAHARGSAGGRASRSRRRTSDRPTPAVPSVAFYISGHGFGHASRQIEIVNALGARAARSRHRRPHVGAALAVRSHRARADHASLTGDVRHRRRPDRQPAPRRSATVARAASSTQPRRARARRSRASARSTTRGCVVSDAPPLACAAAAAAGIPSVVVTNFTWDWIYEGYRDASRRRSRPAADDSRRLSTRRGRLAAADARRLRDLRPIIDVPFVARHATRPRDEVRRALGLPPDRPLVALVVRRLRRERLRPDARSTASRTYGVVVDTLGGDQIARALAGGRLADR